MAQNVKDGLNRMTSSEMCDFVRGWIHSLPDDRFSRVSSIIKLEGEYREKVGSKRKSNDGELDSNTASIPTKSPNKRSSDIIATSHQSPNSAIDLSDWICVFCKLTSHARGLGDLFGPYYVDGEQNGNPKPIVIPSKPRVPPKKMKYVEQSDAGSEIWFHDSCVSWASGVYLIGNHIKNVEEIISKSSQNICSACHLNGANIGCLSKGCQKLYHYICAKESYCLMDETTFSISCPEHRSTSSLSSDHSSSTHNSRLSEYQNTHPVHSILQ